MRVLICLFAAASFCFAASAQGEVLDVGDPFPNFSVANTLSKKHTAYLKLEDNTPVQLSAIPHDVIILEFLNVYCHTCRILLILPTGL